MFMAEVAHAQGPAITLKLLQACSCCVGIYGCVCKLCLTSIS